jgi:hypothetical protein
MNVIRNKRKSIIAVIVLALVLVFVISACAEEPNSVEADRKQTEKSQDQYTKQVPVPSFPYPWMRYLLAQIYTLQNERISTFTYVYSDFQGRIVWSCPSIGYPFPGGTQMTNPLQIVDRTEGDVTIPLAEPNGLYSPDSGLGTYVTCVWEDGTTYAHYEERDVSSSPFPVTTDENGVVIPLENVKPSGTVDLERAKDESK